MSNKHSPGPWRVSLTDDTVVIDATGAEVAAISGDYNQPDEWPTMEANARLIAAAPDLLDTLENLIIGIGMGWDLEGLIAAACDAVDKAREEK